MKVNALRPFALVALWAVAAFPAGIDPAAAARQKIEAIRAGQAKAGSFFPFTAADLNAFARAEVPGIAGPGVREPRLELGNNAAAGSAMVDFLKLEYAQGSQPPWLIRKLIEGEKQ